MKYLIETASGVMIYMYMTYIRQFFDEPLGIQAILGLLLQQF
jgi:hypothetical protein